MLRDRFLAEVRHSNGRHVAADLLANDEEPAEYPFANDTNLPLGCFVVVQREGDVVHPDGDIVARKGTARAAFVSIATKLGLDPVFGREAVAEVDALFEHRPEHPPGTTDPALVDWTGLAFVTIDNQDSRDLDQALCIEREGDSYRVLYALADAAYYVRPGTALFDEALRRGASFYFPGWMVPMLPRALSEGLVSLNPGEWRRALVFDMRLDAGGVCRETTITRARIQSRAKLTYDGVQDLLDRGAAHPDHDAPWGPSLRLLKVVGELRIAEASARGVVSHRRRSVEVGLADHRSFVLYAGLRNDVERYNEQISLLCNVRGAKLIRQAHDSTHMHAIYRVHPAPPEPRLQAFEALVNDLAREHGGTSGTQGADSRWRWNRAGGQTLANFLGNLGDDRVAAAIQRQAILMNVRSSFSASPERHHGVGADVYARFSSPMREVVGIFLHRELIEQLEGPNHDPANDDALRERVIEAANRSKSTQRKISALANRLAIDQLFEHDLAHAAEVRPIRRGTVMGLTHSKIHVTLDEPPIDVKLYRRELERARGETLRLGPSGVSLRTPNRTVVARTGAEISVRVERRDERRDRWILLPVSAT